jgi:hypothetical protein
MGAVSPKDVALDAVRRLFALLACDSGVDLIEAR